MPRVNWAAMPRMIPVVTAIALRCYRETLMEELSGVPSARVSSAAVADSEEMQAYAISRVGQLLDGICATGQVVHVSRV